MFGTPGRCTMKVQYCTSKVCPLLALVSDLFTGHGLIRCFEKVVYLQEYCSITRNLSKWIIDKFLNRCQKPTTRDGGIGSALPQPHQSMDIFMMIWLCDNMVWVMLQLMCISDVIDMLHDMFMMKMFMMTWLCDNVFDVILLLWLYW